MGILKYLGLLVVYICVYIIAMLLAPLLVQFAEMRLGPVDNNHGEGVEPRLPHWLFWFDTSYDNSLWGDHGWRTKHCPVGWDTKWGMTKWLWRNAACGFSWSVLAQDINVSDTYVVKDSGRGLDVDKNSHDGWFLITSSNGAFQYRWVRSKWGKLWTFECGWLLDVYVKSADSYKEAPKATFMFQPQIKTDRRQNG